MSRPQKLQMRSKRLNRSLGGNIAITIILLIFGLYSLLPMVMAVNQSLKPLSELFIYPPKVFVRNPTFDNFRSLYELISTSMVPFSRYLFNTVFVSVVGTVVHILMASMCAFPLAKYTKMPGNKFISAVIVYSLMINPTVADIANYQTMARFNLTDTYWSILLPAFASSFGLYLMKQFIVQIPDSLIEAAKIDGCGDIRINFSIIMPNVRPAWLTLALFSFQNLWNGTNSTYIYSEQMKSLPYALSQLTSGGISRAGASAAVVVIMMIIPVVFFLLTQSKILKTMATSGLKD